MQKSQSAMEYLTTYGWAVLVITIVVIVLLRAGLFGASPNQNSCVSTSGFSCASPTLSSNGVLVTLFGEIGQTITLTGTACTTNATLAGGAASIKSMAATSLSSTQKTNLGFSCPLANSNAVLGTKFNGFLWVQYNTQYQTGIIQRIGEVTSIVTSVSAPSHWLGFKITNSQGTGTGSNFQQMISFNPSNTAYQTNEAYDLGNIRFYQSSTELYSWCESGCTSSSSNAVFWVVIPGGIAANSNVIINASFLGNTIEYDAAYAGECPTCNTITYAKYDNGGNVFNFYDNFFGITLNAGKWGGSGTVSNGIDLTTGGIHTVSSWNPSATVLDWDGYLENLATGNLGTYMANPGNINANQWLVKDGSECGSGYYWQETYGAPATCSTMGALSTSSPYIFSMSGNGATLASYLAMANYGATYSGVITPAFSEASSVVFVAYGAMYMQWVRTRIMPPGDVMPSVTQLGSS